MSGTSLNAILFLISAVFDFYIIVLFLRLVLSWANADYHHPLIQFIVTTTSFIINPMKKFLPTIRRVETATIVAMILVEMLKYFFITLLSFGLPNIMGLLLLAISDTLRIMLEATIIFIIIQSLLSWVQPSSFPYLLNKFVSPILSPVQKLVPPVSGIDLSPLIVIIILSLLVITLVNPLAALGLAITVGT